jgi:hypothetical protein
MHKIHAVLSDAVRQYFDEKAEVIYAKNHVMMIRPAARGSRPVAVQFDPIVWDAVRAADDDTLARYARNVTRIVLARLAHYATDSYGAVFVVAIDDRALDE